MIDKIRILLKENPHTVIAIDGMAASGKTTLAMELAEAFDGEVIHMDDFFLPMEIRNEKRLSEPGGNVHYERFEEEVVEKMLTGEAFDYGVFDCKSMTETSKGHIENKGLIIVEGAYSLRPEFRDIYDLKIFMKIDKETQMKRIIIRDGNTKAIAFKERWIPLEMAYFEAMNIEKVADVVINR